MTLERKGFEKLAEILECSEDNRKLNSFFSIFSNKPSCWNKDCQLCQLKAIGGLGEIKGEQVKMALSYLEKLISEPADLIDIKEYESWGDVNFITFKTYYDIYYLGNYFKNMKGRLMDRLTFIADDSSLEKPFPASDYLEWVSKTPEYQKIKESIAKLQKEAGK